MYAGDQFAEVMGFELQQGRLFSEKTNDSLSVVLNETAVKTLNLTDPIGKSITFMEQTYGSGEETKFTIVGVIKDFHYETLHNEIKPLVIQSNEVIFSRMSYIVARVQAGTNISAIAKLESKWKELAPGLPFQFRFVDTILDSQYQKEERMGKLFTLFSGLSIFVSCIGLFGLAAYTASLRTKEIGIRKIVGAGILDILAFLSKDFTRMVLFSFALAAPVAWWLMEKWWLQSFAFRVEVGVWTFLISGAVALVTAWVSVGYQSIKAAVANPVDSLKSE
jgi:putative ABC transport system permease protein